MRRWVPGLLVALAAGAAMAEDGSAGGITGSWVATEIAGAPVAEGVVSWMTLTAEGRAQGQGGCNGFTGGYRVEGAALGFGPLAATRRACPPAQMAQEAGFFAALGATRGFRIEAGALLLLDEGGAPVARLVPRE